jgi:hypothetical protein
MRATSSGRNNVKPQSRYDGGQDARLPPNGLPKAVRSQNVRTVVGAVQDPYDRKARLVVRINTNVDILESERSRHRISEAAYQTGRLIQGALERAVRFGSASNWQGGDRVDQVIAREERINNQLDDARAIKAWMTFIEREVGRVGARFLREILSGKSYAEYASDRGRTGTRAVHDIAQRFRDLLEDLAESLAATGRRS